jgi:SP family arabinose:H+ symporter-like MFS transporter
MLLGRAMMGFGGGLALHVDALYISEISPAHIRGQLVSYTSAAFSFGILLGFAVGAIFEAAVGEGDSGASASSLTNDATWRLMLATAAVMPIASLALIACGAVPESPRWLIAIGDPPKAVATLRRIYPQTPAAEISRLAAEISADHKAELTQNRAISWRQMLCSPPPYLRRMLIVGIGSKHACRAK